MIGALSLDITRALSFGTPTLLYMSSPPRSTLFRNIYIIVMLLDYSNKLYTAKKGDSN